MIIDLNGYKMEIGFILRSADTCMKADVKFAVKGRYVYESEGTHFTFILDSDGSFSISLESRNPVSVEIDLTLKNEKGIRHIIPCNIHGDNNLGHAKPGYYPNLTYEYPDFDTSSPEWEFRADRASHPVSIITCERGAAGISIDPYSETDSENGFIRNGLISKLPGTAGVSLGYRNYPFTFTFKEMMTLPTAHMTCKASARGRIRAIEGSGGLACAEILRELYYSYRECPEPSHSIRKYLEGFLDSYENVNWSRDLEAFTNEECSVPGDPVLKPWRPLIAAGWTGTGVIAYPLLSAMELTGDANGFSDTLTGLFDTMASRINPRTGLLYDLTRPWRDSDVNGWWAGYMVSDCHCAYTNGNGVFYLLKAYLLQKKSGIERKKWLDTALSVLDAAINLQGEDGNYGYTYSLEEPAVLDWDGFAGCWFTAACALAYKVSGESKYLESAEKGINFYYGFVRNLDCWGTPMDTWKSVDQEGNLAFVRAATLLHESTKDSRYLEMAVHGAEYEYLWRYAIKARPEFRPLKDSGWNSCGGSVTSVSNPHIHPMGVNITAELLYIYRITGDLYHLHRAMDGLCWGLATADLYPETTGYGRLGVMTERYCPSDGLTVERYSDTGEPSSIWFTFNGWAGASVLEGLTETLLALPGETDVIMDRKADELPDIIKPEAD